MKFQETTGEEHATGTGGHIKYSMSPIQRGDKPQTCNGCGECLAKCPQGINIPEELKRVQRELKLS